ncbi:MAG: hypothetical protein RBU37_11060 [Myxococcota bacterium]|jgi:hypothetical protein|nr:hypothetical protein [Myxococcota bacterium]
MPATIATYRCLVISPSDVAQERDAVERAITKWNAHVGGGLHARVEAVRWESHARPEMGEPAQAIINKQLVDDCDFGIAIFWSRLGSPTAQHESGSSEEIARLLAQGARVMVYFSTKPVPQDAALNPQFKDLQALRQRYQEQGLLGSFGTVEELERNVTLHVTSLMANLLLQNQTSGQPIPSTGTLTAPAPDIRVTTEAAFAPEGDSWLGICVQNHSPVRFFAVQVTLELSNGTHLYLQRDAITHEFQAKRGLDPGDSFTFHINPDVSKLWDYEAGPVVIVCAVVKDAIGRTFRSDPASLKTVLELLKRDRKR